METEWVELSPGVKIEVTKRYKNRRAILKAANRARLDMTPEQRTRALAEVMKRSSPVGRKYSLLMLDEAVQTAAKVGLKKAAKLTGVNLWSIRAHRKSLVADGIIKRERTIACRRYTKEQKEACVKLALHLQKTTPNKIVKSVAYGKHTYDRKIMGYSTVSAFKEAGRRLGVNGYSIWYQWHIGMVKLPSTPGQG